ncbi:MAG: cytochrome c family protein [Rhodobacteraceae bacterium]|nr:cytochrome c family protein [Paracoccaceae bacterium]
MLDTMTLTKVVGALCGAFLVFLLSGWVGESLFHIGGGHGGEHAQAYVIETASAEGGAAEEEVVDFGAILAAADPAKGEKVFGKCKACHKVDGTDGTGPHLNGVVERGIGTVAGFAYSDVLSGKAGEAWTPDNLNAFLENPKGWAPGTKMGFAGLKKITDRADVVSYLQSTGG